ncbi:MAG: DUF4091 domain-containing protein [Clostridia bacterium]|nr:DUF4091 domain-containing protein [Clostridia bacterium]
MKLQTKLVSSLTKVFPDKVNGNRLKEANVMQNEPFSFQIAFKNSETETDVIPVFVRVETDLDISLISEYSVGYVPVTRADFKDSDNYFERKTPGLYPDMLFARKTNAEVDDDGPSWAPRWTEQGQEVLLDSVIDSYQSLWFTVNENGKPIKPGKYSITVLFYKSADKECAGREKLTLNVLDAALPKQSLFYTNWFHCDCHADTYGVKVFSERFFEIMRSFVTEAAKHGMNMILLPAFTPPLDTTIGKERKTVQLVRVEYKYGEYIFDFSLTKKYIDLCRECGIKYFEHSHLFTQWGAQSAPKIIAKVGGKHKRIFGWDTDARSEEYICFLKSYLRELKGFLAKVGIYENILFHISDEPDIMFISYYENAKKTIGKEIKDYMCGDALSHFEYYERGLTKKPIVIVNSKEMKKFVDSCDDYWVYYTGGQLREGCSNRVISTTSARNRIIGLQMYVGGAKGFLHWGYNYYYGVLSHGLFNPAVNPCGYNHLAGTSYVVYPGIKGEAIPSLRMKVFYEGLNDYRALQLLEDLIGRKKTLGFIEKAVGKVSYKFCLSNKKLFEFRQKLNDEIIKNL